MEKKRRAENLIAQLRWLVIVGGLTAACEGMPLFPNLVVVVGLVVCYNGAQTWLASNGARFAKHGRRMSLAANALDIAAITYVVAGSYPEASLGYLLYCFVLVSVGFSTSNLRRLAVTASVVLAADAVACFLSLSKFNGLGQLSHAIAARSIVLIFGALVSAYIAKSRSRDELASERGSYLNAIQKCGARLTSFKSVHDVARHVLSTVVTETAASGGQLLLIDDDSRELECEASYSAAYQAEDADMPAEKAVHGYANWVISSGSELVIRGNGGKGGDEEISEDNRPIIAMPLLWHTSGGEDDVSVLGILIVWGTPGETFGEDAVDILRIFAAISAAAIVNLRLYTNLQKSFLATLQSLAKGLEARDEYTRGHSDRVMQVACMIAQELGVTGDSLELLRNASLLHDIGKIGVADAILRKAGKLTAEEWESMRRHPVVSEEICVPLGLPPEVLFLVKHHHERLDGKGYPDGLMDREQPLLLRILVVSDSFDAMRSRRPYRDVMPREELRAELNRCAGRTLDPTVVDTLLRLQEHGELESIYELHDRMTSFTFLKPEEEAKEAA